ncbi:hypothetical protein NP233_g8442 [Leucocoprinus birnbaumii]|uniref:Uncharacterized protein n=1 Tax=Leucocoprinus birnbaumii TaxID=56174 RepID=A0AAD5VMB7_9AGAR|nr:hypothetical protein NP233_g8442 [Leucocoprinus birnbaumii]
MQGTTRKKKSVSAKAGESVAQKELPQDVQEGLDKYKQIIQEAETLRDEANAASITLNALLNGNADQAAAYGITANEAFEKCHDILEKQKVLKDEAKNAQTKLIQSKKTLKGLKFSVPAYAHLFQGMSIKAPKKMQLNVKADKNRDNPSALSSPREVMEQDTANRDKNPSKVNPNDSGDKSDKATLGSDGAILCDEEGARVDKPMNQEDSQAHEGGEIQDGEKAEPAGYVQDDSKVSKAEKSNASGEEGNRNEDSPVHVEGRSLDAAGGRNVVEGQGDFKKAKSLEVKPASQIQEEPKVSDTKKDGGVQAMPIGADQADQAAEISEAKNRGGVQEVLIDVDQANVLDTVMKNSTRFESESEAFEQVVPDEVIDGTAQRQKAKAKAPGMDQGVMGVDANMSNDNLPRLLGENDVSGLSKSKKKPKPKTESKKKRKHESDTDSNKGSALAQNVPSSSTTSKKKARTGNGNGASSSGSLQNIKDMVARLIGGKSKGGEGPDPLATIRATDRLKVDKREEEAPSVDKFIDCTEEDKDACAAELAEQLDDHIKRGWIIHTNGCKLIRWEASILGRAMLESCETALHLMTSDDGNILCAYHAHVKKDKIVHDQAEGKDRGWRLFTGVPFVHNASKGSTAAANRRPGHLHCGCKEDEVLIEAILRKTTILKSSSTSNEETMQDEHLKPFERSFFARAFMAWTGLKPGHFFRKSDSGEVQTYGDLLESQIAILEERLAEWKAAQQNEGDN